MFIFTRKKFGKLERFSNNFITCYGYTSSTPHFRLQTKKGASLMAASLLQRWTRISLCKLKTKMKGKLLVTTSIFWRHWMAKQMMQEAESSEGTSSLSLRKRRLLSCQAAEVWNSVGYTAGRILGISNISLKGNFWFQIHCQPHLPSADHNQRRLKAANAFPM